MQDEEDDENAPEEMVAFDSDCSGEVETPVAQAEGETGLVEEKVEEGELEEGQERQVEEGQEGQVEEGQEGQVEEGQLVDEMNEKCEKEDEANGVCDSDGYGLHVPEPCETACGSGDKPLGLINSCARPLRRATPLAESVEISDSDDDAPQSDLSETRNIGPKLIPMLISHGLGMDEMTVHGQLN